MMRNAMVGAAVLLLGWLLLAATAGARAVQLRLVDRRPMATSSRRCPAPMTIKFSYAYPSAERPPGRRRRGRMAARLDRRPTKTSSRSSSERRKPLPPGKYQIEWAAYVRQHYHPDGGVDPLHRRRGRRDRRGHRATPAAGAASRRRASGRAGFALSSASSRRRAAGGSLSAELPRHGEDRQDRRRRNRRSSARPPRAAARPWR